MSYRDRERFDNGRPDQYGQDHYNRRQFGHEPQQGGWGQQHQGWHSSEPQRGDWRGRDASGGRERDRHPLSHEPFGHEPFTHSAFGESEPPRYFGTGSQGHGGGPSFTGGTYGTADWRSDSPYFDEVGFNRGNYEDPLSRSRGSHGQGRQQRRYPLGPKGYTRSDERLREDISERLMQAYDIDSSEVTVQVLSGKVTLEGTVPNRYMKHAIEDIADGAPGVQDVDNRVRVTSSRWSTNATDAGSLATGANNPAAGSGTATRTTARRDS